MLLGADGEGAEGEGGEGLLLPQGLDRAVRCAVLCCAGLCCVCCTLCCAMVCRAVLCCTLCCAMLCNAVLCRAGQGRAVLCNGALCCAVAVLATNGSYLGLPCSPPPDSPTPKPIPQALLRKAPLLLAEEAWSLRQRAARMRQLLGPADAAHLARTCPRLFLKARTA